MDDRRNYRIINRNITDPEERTRDVLYRNNRHNDIGIMIRIMWEARRKALEPPKGRKNGNQNKSTRLPLESHQTNLRTGHDSNIHARDFVLEDCPRTDLIVKPRTGLPAETLFSPTVFVQLGTTW